MAQLHGMDEADGGCRCPRCGSPFDTCTANRPKRPDDAAGTEPCACSQLRLGADLLAALRQRYAGCLCLPCLHALQADPATLQDRAAAP